ncbi:MAG: NAD-binding protein [Candidatus Eremiobacteraeota bacterium]|nr:NAD-binding protein [Candidatus Eremiobacteraeota bacterium]
MAQLPLIIVVGGDELALRVCEELTSTRGHDVVLLWHADEELAARATSVGAAFVGLPPNDYESLRTVGVMHATSIMPVAEEDRLNLQVALKARDLNPKIRVVLRQFNRTLARKLEQNLPDCSAVSLSAQSAATYAGAAIDPACFFALQFPDFDGPLLGFSDRAASDFRIAGLSIEEAERRLKSRIISAAGQTNFQLSQALQPQDRVVAFGPMEELCNSWPREAATPIRESLKHRVAAGLSALMRAVRRTEPLLLRIFGAGAVIGVLAVLYFMWALHLDVVKALYYVITTMATVGYGDITPLVNKGPVHSFFVAMFIMISGIAITGVFIAAITAALNRAQVTALRGLRHIASRDHVVVCGAGNIGTRVIDFLLRMDQSVVVIEQNPDNLLIERARDRQLDLLTGDATSDGTLRFCNLRHARSVVALTGSDTANLEVGLGARAGSAHLGVVLRIADSSFAHSIGRQFHITKSFSAIDLTAPAIAGLSRFPGTRGRVEFYNEEYNVGERLQGAVPAPPPADFCIPLYVWREDTLIPLHDFAEMKPYDRLLFIVPLSQFRGREQAVRGERSSELAAR